MKRNKKLTCNFYRGKPINNPIKWLNILNVCPVTEGSSEFSDSDLDMSRRRSRRSQKKKVNYCETSESEGSQAETNRAKMKPRHRSESDGQSETQSTLVHSLWPNDPDLRTDNIGTI